MRDKHQFHGTKLIFKGYRFFLHHGLCFLSLSSSSLFRVRDKNELSKNVADKEIHTDSENHVKKASWACGKGLDCSGYVDKYRAISKYMQNKIAFWCALAYRKFQEICQRCKALWKSRRPSFKVYAGKIQSVK